MGKGYARNVGRLGALAVALGVGYGLADAPALAAPADSAGPDNSSSASASPGRQARHSAGVSRGAGPRAAATTQRRAGSDTANRGSDLPAVPRAASAKRANDAIPTGPAPAAQTVPVPAAAVAAPASAAPVPAPAAVQSAPAALPVAAPAAPVRRTATSAPRPASASQLISTALAPLVGGGTGDAPAAGPLMWTALAWTRRQSGVAQVRSSAASPTASSLTMSGNLLVNPGAEFGDPSLSGFSAVTIPGWTLTGTPTVIKYGTARNLWPMGLANPTPNLPSFFSFPKPKTNPTGGNQFFGGGNVADATLTQTVDLTGAQALIDGGSVSYNLSGEFGGFLIDPSAASVKVTFLDQNKTYLGSAQTKPVGMLSRLFMTAFKQRETTGVLPEGTRYAEVQLVLDDRNWRKLGFRADYNNAYADNLSFTIDAPLVAPLEPTPPASTVGSLDHFFMVYMENKGYDSIVGSPNAPFLNSLINAYGFADNYYGLTHPSLPNYYPILGGSDFGKTYNCKDACIDAPATLMENLDNAGLTWRSYAQGFEAGMNPLESSGEYAVDETPFPAYTYFANNPDPNYATDHLVPLTQMATDLQSAATTPNYVWFAADENSNGEGPVDFPWGMLKFAISQITPGHQYNVPALDEYLSQTVPTILNSNVWNDPSEKSVLVVTFDEDNNNTSLGFGNEGNHIVTVVIPSPGAIAGGMKSGPFIATNHYNHYSLLRFIEDSLGLPPLTANDAYAAPMNEFWDGVGTAGAGSVV